MIIYLKKIETRDDAIHDQEDKYPSGEIIAVGHMFHWSLPKVGESFYVMIDKLTPLFRTSVVVEIINYDNGNIEFKTLNSIYQILIKDED